MESIFMPSIFNKFSCQFSEEFFWAQKTAYPRRQAGLRRAVAATNKNAPPEWGLCKEVNFCR